MTHNESLALLTMMNASMPANIHSLNKVVLGDDLFRIWPASASKHHTEDGGLIIHTAEVALSSAGMRDENPSKPLNWITLFTSIVWHDYGKIWD